MPKLYRLIETVTIHVVATVIIIFALLIATGIVRAEPRGHCHQHHGVTHCH